jgi:uncharacterized protein YlaI
MSFKNLVSFNILYVICDESSNIIICKLEVKIKKLGNAPVRTFATV